MTKKSERDPLTERPGRFGNADATQLLFDLNAVREVKLKRKDLVITALVVLCIVLGLAIKSMLPLKTVAVYRMEVDKFDNQQVQRMNLSPYEPNLNEIRARLKDVAVKMFEIKPRELRKSMDFVQLFMSGQANRQFDEFLASERVFARAFEDPTLLREVEVTGVNKITDRVMLIDLQTKERVGTGTPRLKRRTLTVNYEIKPAQTDEEVLGPNPAGIYIVSFTIADTVNSTQ